MVSCSEEIPPGLPFVAGRGSPCLTLRNELSEETQALTKQQTLLGRDAQVERNSIRQPRRTALPRGSWSWVLW